MYTYTAVVVDEKKMYNNLSYFDTALATRRRTVSTARKRPATGGFDYKVTSQGVQLKYLQEHTRTHMHTWITNRHTRKNHLSGAGAYPVRNACGKKIYHNIIVIHRNQLHPWRAHAHTIWCLRCVDFHRECMCEAAYVYMSTLYAHVLLDDRAIGQEKE